MALTVLQNLGEPWRRAKLVRLGKLYSSRVLNTPLVKPKSVTLTLTTRCNLRCVMCNHWRLVPGDIMSYDDACHYIDQIAEFSQESVLEISGGEPFLHPRIMDIIAFATQQGLRMNITTNAMLFTPARMEQLFASTVDRLQISMDGPDAETHDGIRGIPGSFGRIVAAVKELDRLRKEENRPLGLNLTMVIQRDNFTRLTEMYHFARALGFDSVTYQPVNDNNLDITYVNPANPLRVPLGRIAELDAELDRLIELRKAGAPIGNAVHYLESTKRYFRNERQDAVKCYAGFVMGVISPDGKLWTCMGNAADLRRMTIGEAWQSAEMAAKRRAIKGCETPCLYPCYLESDADSLRGVLWNTLLR